MTPEGVEAVLGLEGGSANSVRVAGRTPVPPNDMEFSGEQSESAATTCWAAVLHRPACLGGAWLPSGNRAMFGGGDALRREQLDSSYGRGMSDGRAHYSGSRK